MQAVTRQYSGKGAKELFDLLAKNLPELESVMRSVPGFVTYTLARSGDGGFSVTVCRDQAGIDASSQKAKEWIAQHGAHIAASPPVVTAGTVLAHLK